MKDDGSAAVRCAYRQVEAEGHLDVVDGVWADEFEKQAAKKKRGDTVHRERLNGPVDEQGQADRSGAASCLDDLGEIDFDHYRIHHEEQADGNGDRDDGGIVDVDGLLIQEARDSGRRPAQQNTDDDAEEHPHRQIALEKPEAFAFIHCLLLVHMQYGYLALPKNKVPMLRKCHSVSI